MGNISWLYYCLVLLINSHNISVSGQLVIEPRQVDDQPILPKPTCQPSYGPTKPTSNPSLLLLNQPTVAKSSIEEDKPIQSWTPTVAPSYGPSRVMGYDHVFKGNASPIQLNLYELHNLLPLFVQQYDDLVSFSLNQFTSRHNQEFNQEYLNTNINVSIFSDGRTSKPPFPRAKMSLGEYLSGYLKQSSECDNSGKDPICITPSSFPYYMQQVDLELELPYVMKHYGIDPMAPRRLFGNSHMHPSLFRSTTLFIGGSGIRTSLHYDRCCGVDPAEELSEKAFEDPGVWNFFVQLSGRRKLVLFRPECDLHPEVGTAWPHVARSHDFVHSIEEQHPNDLEAQLRYIRTSAYPELAECWAERKIIYLQEKEALLIPPRWWHYSEILKGPSVAVNWWFFTAKEEETVLKRSIMRNADEL